MTATDCKQTVHIKKNEFYEGGGAESPWAPQNGLQAYVFPDEYSKWPCANHERKNRYYRSIK